MENSKTPQQILIEAANFLENNDRWGKHAFFIQNKLNPSGECSMCVHGIIQYMTMNVVYKKQIDSGELPSTSYYWSKGAQEAIGAQNLAFKHGLNYKFNDNGTTTKQDIIDKLHHIATLSE